MKNLSKREKVLIISVISLAFFYFYYTLYLSRMLIIIQSLNYDLKKIYQENKTSYSSKIYILNKAIHEEQILIKYKSALISIPQNKNETQIVFNIKNFADYSNVSLNNISFNDVFAYTDGKSDLDEKEDNFKTLSVNLNIFGDMKNIVNFLTLIESDSRITVVNDISLVKMNDNIFRTSVSLHYYYMDSIDIENHEDV